MRRVILWLTVVIVLCTDSDFVSGQVIQQEKISLVGTLEAVYPGEVIVKDENGKSRTFLIQENADAGVPLTGLEGGLDFPATVKVTGEFPLLDIRRGTEIRFEAHVSKSVSDCPPDCDPGVELGSGSKSRTS